VAGVYLKVLLLPKGGREATKKLRLVGVSAENQTGDLPNGS